MCERCVGVGYHDCDACGGCDVTCRECAGTGLNREFYDVNAYELAWRIALQVWGESSSIIVNGEWIGEQSSARAKGEPGHEGEIIRIADYRKRGGAL